MLQDGIKELRRIKGKGRGLFATRKIKRGEVVETSPVILIPESQADPLSETKLQTYVFSSSRPGKRDESVLCLGYGSLFNHSNNPNLIAYQSPNQMEFVARRPIDPGEELTICYGRPEDLWFEVK